MTSMTFPLREISPFFSLQNLPAPVKKRQLTFSSCDSAFQSVKKVKCLPEEDQKQEDDAPSLAKSSKSSGCMSEGSTHLNESRGKQKEDPTRLKKLLKNRESATRCRNKKRNAINSMAADIALVNHEIEQMNSQVKNYGEFLEKLQESNAGLGKKVEAVSEEKKQLQLQLAAIHSQYAQFQQTIFMMYNQSAGIEFNGIKFQ
eukprot:TRINITY_DN10004_c0_g1_i1.p1 TRINITY_DN10004_c0_g1~~TRINITY_DN10004_c0_g1_i1.p1  ORF type:complete len:202 (-),score=46.78 TRINITY_DN10004_c0_g1_i1:159-764(-)